MHAACMRSACGYKHRCPNGHLFTSNYTKYWVIKKPHRLMCGLAGCDGFEPPAIRLTNVCSTVVANNPCGNGWYRANLYRFSVCR